MSFAVEMDELCVSASNVLKEARNVHAHEMFCIYGSLIRNHQVPP